MLAPVLAWPLMRASADVAGLGRMWLATGACLLAAGTAADLARRFVPRPVQAAMAVAWCTAIALAASLALKWNSAWPLGLLLGLRALEAGVRIWRGAHDDADWIGWGRDLAGGIALLFWGMHW